jgi:hypothetical protein
MRMRAFERWIVVGAAAFALSSSVALKLAISDERPVRLGTDEPLLSQIRRGAPVTVKLDPDTCDFVAASDLPCDSPYVGYYNRRNNTWVLTRKPSSLKDQIMTGIWKNAPDEPGYISLWGLVGTFDEEGALAISGKVRGRIKSDWQNAAR